MVFPIGLLLVLALGVVDYLAPPWVALSLIYLIVCMAAGWFGSARASVSLAILSGLTLGVIEEISAGAHPTHWWLAWDIVSRVAVFSCVAWLTNHSRNLNRRLNALAEERTRELAGEVERHNRSLEALKLAEERYRAVLANTPAAVWVSDAKGVTLFVSDQVDQLIGYTADEVYQKSPHFWWGRVHPEDLPAVTATFDSLFEGGEFNLEYRMQHKDGRWLWVNDRGSMRFSGTGEKQAYGVCLDISDRKRAEEALKRSEQQTRDILATTQDAYMLAGGEGEVQDVNAAFTEMTGFERSEMIGRNILEIDTKLTREEAEEIKRRVIEAGSGRFETRLRRKARPDIEIEVSLSSPPSANGSAYCFLRDITKRKHDERVLEIQRDIASRLSMTSNLMSGLRSLVDMAVAIEGVDSGGIYFMDPEEKEVRLYAHRGLSEEFVAAVSVYPVESPQGRLVLSGEAVYLDAAALEAGMAPLAGREGLRSLAVVPLRHEGRVVGCLNLASHKYDSTPQRARELIELLGAQAAGAIARMRGEEALRSSERRLHTLITGAPVVLFAGDKEGIITCQEGKGLANLGWKGGENVGRRVGDVFKDSPDVLLAVERVLRGEEFSTTENVGQHTFDVWYTPERDAAGEVVGYVGVATNITDRLRLERQLLMISDREQDRIGQEIHDGLCQQLVSLAFDAATIETELAGMAGGPAVTARRLSNHMDASITEARRLSRGLFPIRIEVEGLAPALEELLRTMANRRDITCNFVIEPVRVISKMTASNLYRIAQEAFNNITKHSGATVVSFELRRFEGKIRMRIEDNGSGFLPDARPPGNPQAPVLDGMGLHIMKYRARMIGADLRIHSKPGHGAVISCLVPEAPMG
jgi:PAS domain S-box-containing protein